MSILKKKSLLAISISMALSIPLLTACGGSSDEEKKPDSAVIDNHQSGSQDGKVDIKNIKVFAENAKFEPVAVAEWTPTLETPDHTGSDERVINMSMQNGNLVAVTKWHNSIVKVPSQQFNDGDSSKIAPELFANIPTAGHGIFSKDTDIVSGASEHALLDVQYTKDNKAMYAIVEAPKAKTDGDDTYGLFKVALNADGSIPSEADKPLHRTASVKRAEGFDNVKAMLPLENGSLLAVDNEYNAVRLYDNTFKFDEEKSFGLGEGNHFVAWSADSQYLYLVVNNNESYSITKRPLSDLKKVEKTLKVSSSVQDIYNDGTNLLVVEDKAVQLLNKDLTTKSTISFTKRLEASSVSTDFKRAVVEDSDGVLWLVDIENNQLNIPLKLDLDAKDIKFGYFILADKDTLVYQSNRGKIEKLALNQKTVNLMPATVLKNVVNDVGYITINHEYEGSGVRYDLDLPTKAPNLPITYKWSSSNPDVISNTGKVNQPAKGQKPVDVTLTLTATADDDSSLTQTKTFKLKVLPKSETINNSIETDFVASGVLDNGIRFNQIDNAFFKSNTANEDGSLYVLYTNSNRTPPTGEKDENKDDILSVRSASGVMLLQKQADNSLKAVMGDIGAGKKSLLDIKGTKLTKPEAKSALWQGNDTLYILLGDEKAGALVKKKFSNPTDFSSLEAEARQDWEVVKEFDKPVIEGFINEDKTNMTVVSVAKTKVEKEVVFVGKTKVEKEKVVPAEYQFTNYAINIGGLNEINSYTMDADSFSGIRSATFDKTGKYLFIGKDSGLERYVDGKLSGTLTVDQRYHSGVVTKDGNFIAGGRSGHLLFVKNAMQEAAITDDNATKVYLSRENYDGSSYPLELDHHKGRIYSLAKIGNDLFVNYYGIGTSIVDITDFNNPVEKKFMPYTEQYLGIPSGNGEYLLRSGNRDGKFRINKLK